MRVRHSRARGKRGKPHRVAVPTFIAVLAVLALCGCQFNVGSEAAGTTSSGSTTTAAPIPDGGPSTAPPSGSPSSTATSTSSSASSSSPSNTSTSPTTNGPETPPAGADILATAKIHAATGGSVSAKGVKLTVPPDVLDQDATATISSDSTGVYDLTVNQTWSGSMQVSVPLANDNDMVLHQIDGDWVAEGAAVGDGTVAVDHLSPFTTLVTKAKGALCLSSLNPKAFAECLLAKGVKKVSAALAAKLAAGLGPCFQQLVSSASSVGSIALSMLTGDCVGHAGEGNWTPPATSSAQPPLNSGGGGGTTDGGGGGTVANSGQINLAQGGSAPYGSYYAVTLSGYAAGARVALTCRDSADSGGFYSQTVTVNSSGNASFSRFCYSADGPDHWVTDSPGGESNHVSWGSGSGGGGGSNPPPPAATTYTETTGAEAHTWTNYNNAGGTAGQVIPAHTSVQISCRVQGFQVQDGDTWWYRIASAPWNNGVYVSADPFYNNGQTSGGLHGTPFYDPAVPVC